MKIWNEIWRYFHTLYSPWALALLAIIPLVVFCMTRRGYRGRLRFSSLQDLRTVAPTWRIRLRFLPIVVRIICMTLLILALARPRQGNKQQIKSTNGVVMEIVIDRSGSMGREMNYNGRALTRLEVVKRVLKDFIKGGNGLPGRQNDMLGLVTFARFADTACPLVTAHDALLSYIQQTQLVPDGSPENATNIGDSLALAYARLKTAEEEITRRNASVGQSSTMSDKQKPEFEIQSKAIILLTDGRCNAGERSPEEAAKLAAKDGIKVYTIGIGSGEPIQQQSFFGMTINREPELDEPLLKNIAELTGGFYGRAGDAKALAEICQKIDQLEKTEIESIEYNTYDEKYRILALAALCTLALEILLGCTLFRKIP
ncbi:MAG: VWA domain-containing protein [Phycisphaerae bacterium]|nr:VWA domain-containing protein [Phycisphaerae bacterium]